MLIEVYDLYHDGIHEKIHSMNCHGVAVIMPTTNLTQAIDSARRMINLAHYPLRMIIGHDIARVGFIKTLNTIAKEINAEFIVYVAQDSLAGAGWLKIAMENLVENDKSLFAFNDGIWKGRLAQFGVVRMKFSEKLYGLGNIFYTGYHTHRADDELTLISKLTDQYSYSADALMLEVDYRSTLIINPKDISLFSKRKIEIIDKFKNHRLRKRWWAEQSV